MNLGNNIRISMLFENSAVKATVYFHNRMVSCIQSVNMTLTAGPFGEEIEEITFRIWDPREIYVGEEQCAIQAAFIDEVRQCGAKVEIVSALSLADSGDASKLMDDVGNMHDNSIDTEEGDDSLAKAVAGIAAVVGLAALFSSNGKKQKVQETARASIHKNHDRLVPSKK